MAQLKQDITSRNAILNYSVKITLELKQKGNKSA